MQKLTLASLALATSLIACGGSVDTPEASTRPVEQQQPPNVAPAPDESCTAGATRACKPAGGCATGTQTCTAVSAGELSTSAWGDCIATCAPTGCPSGQAPTYRPVIEDKSQFVSGIFAGPGGAVYDVACEPSQCTGGKVGVQVPGYSDARLKYEVGHKGDETADHEPLAMGAISCVDAPPACAGGKFPQLTQQGQWICIEGCDVIVQYGGGFGGARVCAEKPKLTCPSGQTPTYVYETQAWSCEPTCDNGEYDLHTYVDLEVCVPC